jgi:uncharacterized membrane protein
MRRFFAIYFRQWLNIILVFLGIGSGLFLTLSIGQATALSRQWLQILLWGLVAAGFLLAVFVAVWKEYRQQITFRAFLREAVLMLISVVVMGAFIYLGIILGVKVGTAAVPRDGTGIFVILFLLLGAILAIVPGIIFAALVPTFWKLRSSNKRDSSEGI